MMVRQQTLAKKKKQKVPDYLVYEVIDGKPIYFRGYKDVLNGTKKPEDIMGCSSLQFILIGYLLRILFKITDESKFYIGTNEAGLHLNKRNNLSNDIALYSKKVLRPDKVSKHYADVPPCLVIEVDTDCEFEHLSPPDYVNIKIQKLLDFGVEKVIWIFSASKKVTIAIPGQAWKTVRWSIDIELLEGHTFNIAAYLEKEGIEVE